MADQAKRSLCSCTRFSHSRGFSFVAEAETQDVTVTGVTICNLRRFANVLVELWKKDTLNPDELLDTYRTNSDGDFSMKGREDELTSINQYIRISHECELPEGKENCTRVFELEVPKDKINNGVYDHTFIILDTMYKGEKLEC